MRSSIQGIEEASVQIIELCEFSLPPCTRKKSPNYQQNYGRMDAALWIESRSHEEKERA